MKTILRDTHSLDAAGVDNISEQIADVLADYPYITKRDILRLRLGAEEILLHWRQEVGELRVELSIEEKGRWVDLMLQMDGVPYRLTPPDAAEVSGVSGVESTLANLGIDWTYQFDHGQNSAYISVEARESHRVRHVLTAMALAAASAVLLRLLPAAVDVVQNYVTQPPLALCSRFLTAVVTPMMLLAVISGVLSVGSPRTFHRVGRYACIRFLFSMLVVILCAGVLCAVFFPVPLFHGGGGEPRRFRPVPVGDRPRRRPVAPYRRQYAAAGVRGHGGGYGHAVFAAARGHDGSAGGRGQRHRAEAADRL